ncbi:hypothetical protein [Streptomyces sp. DI166]|uniref:hypothetical protein n=1 Tax=Streptomyces sp. DI166 TaxID=1839783 RepID=UPI00114745BF|nr:hypothetical protein [Streptomyces sp. DI166]
MAAVAQGADPGAVLVAVEAGAARTRVGLAGSLGFGLGCFDESAGHVGPGAVELSVVVEAVGDVDAQAAEFRLNSSRR